MIKVIYSLLFHYISSRVLFYCRYSEIVDYISLYRQYYRVPFSSICFL